MHKAVHPGLQTGRAECEALAVSSDVTTDGEVVRKRYRGHVAAIRLRPPRE